MQINSKIVKIQEMVKLILNVTSSYYNRTYSFQENMLREKSLTYILLGGKEMYLVKHCLYKDFDEVFLGIGNVYTSCCL